MFDILNCHNPYGKGFKGPIDRNNIEVISKALMDSVEYLNNLKLPGGRKLNVSRRKTFIIGFTTAIRSCLGIAQYVFSSVPESKYILTYKLGQDHIETLFSKIRSKGGFNNNPDVSSFKSALRALITKTDITPSPNANSIDLDEITGTAGPTLMLIASSKLRKKYVADAAVEQDGEEFEEFEDDSFQLELNLSKPITDIVEYIGRLGHKHI